MHNNNPHHVFLGDCLEVMQKFEADRFDLIYLDPPFFTGKEQTLATREGDKKYQFSDTWQSEHDYTDFMRLRITQMHRILKNTGSIFVHCDNKASHLIRIILDDIFGKNHFRSEIIWYYKRWSNMRNGLLPQHQNILYYSKTNNFKFNKDYTDYSATTNIDQILQKRQRDTRGKVIYAKDIDGNTISADDKKGVPVGDVWEIPFLNPKAQERTGYPTQKPIILLEKIIELASDVGDEILDPFCGSGTTCVAAQLTQRNFVGIDISSDAVELAHNRLMNPIKTHSDLLNKGQEAYKVFDTWIDSHLIGIACNRVARNSGIDAILKKNINGRIGLIRVQRETETMSDAVIALSKASKTKNNTMMILIKTSDEIFDNNQAGVFIINSVALELKKLENYHHPQITANIFDTTQTQQHYFL
jgi:site-specific DNA-methyltransferase (adenine-specific)